MSVVRKVSQTNANSIAEFNSELIRHSKLNFLKGTSPFFADWFIIAAAISTAHALRDALSYVLAIFVIASCQHRLLVLVHDASHFRISKKPWLNDLISNVLGAFPNFFCTARYRANHLKHHRYLNTMEDPDWARKVNSSEWHFPQTKKRLVMTLGKILLTGWFRMTMVFFHFSGLLDTTTYTTREGLSLLGQKILFYSIAGIVIAKLNLGDAVLMYWVVPFLTFLPLIERVRSISEHFALTYADEYNQTRNILCSPLEAFVFGPHNIRYHLVHHLYPSVPQYNLPSMYKQLMKNPEFAEKSHTNDAYFIFGNHSVLDDLTSLQKKAGI